MDRIFQNITGWMQPWRRFLQLVAAAMALGFSAAAWAIPSTVVVTPSVNPSVSGQSVTLSATITCGAFLPTGTASFFDGVVLMGVVPLAGGVSSLTTSSLSVGAHAITVIYNGDINCDPAAGGVVQTVNLITSATTLTSLPNPSVVGANVTMTATVVAVAPGAGTPTGTVSFFDGAVLLGTTALDGAGQATLSTNTLTAGAHSITATYNGAPDFAGSTSPALIQVVNAAPLAAAVPTLGAMAQVLLTALIGGLGWVGGRRWRRLR